MNYVCRRSALLHGLSAAGCSAPPRRSARIFTENITVNAAPAAILARGVLRVGTAGDYLPMSYLDPATNTYVGFDAELAEDLAAALGVELEYVETSWPTLMEDTLAGKFDLAICGITITEYTDEACSYLVRELGIGCDLLDRLVGRRRIIYGFTRRKT